jgi:transcriptional regulator with XRE-family HTH domain
MLFAEQLRAARSLLNWSQDRLATESGVGIATIRRVEAQIGSIRAISHTLEKLQVALEKGGITFIPSDGTGGPGVRLRSAPRTGRKR